MRALLVGAGGMGRAWAQNLEKCERCELAGWVDIRPSAAESAANDLKIGGVTTGVSLAEVAERCSPDFVVDVSAPAGHRDVTVEALGLGLPVLGEKPMAESMDEAFEMIEASEKAGKLYMVSQSRRYDSGMIALRDAIRGSLGQLGILNVDFYIGAHFGGFRDEMESPLLLDMAIHTFDQARFLCDDVDPVSVIADEFNPSWSWYEGSASATAAFQMANGVRFTYRGSWCAEGAPTSWEGDWRAIGSQGSALWALNGEVSADKVVGADGFIRETERTTYPKPEILSGIQGSLNEFLDSLKTGERPQAECHDNIKSLAMVFAAKKAAELGVRTQVEWKRA